MAAPAAVAVDRPRDGSGLPLSYAQSRLWFLDGLEGGLPRYHMAQAVRVRGGLDVAALGRAFGALAARHEVLRTRLVEGRGSGAAGVGGAGSGYEVVTAADADGALARAQDFAGRRFDLASAAPLRVAGWSGWVGRIMSWWWCCTTSRGTAGRSGCWRGELAALYRAAVGLGAAELPALPVQYGDYAVWQRAWLRGAVLARELGYWRGALGGAPGLLRLPLDRARGRRFGSGGGGGDGRYGAAVVAGVRAVARRRG